jgi:hypothetical protein
MVQEEDAQLLSEPIVAPIKVRKYNLVEKDMPVTRFDKGSVVLPFRCGLGWTAGRGSRWSDEVEREVIG